MENIIVLKFGGSSVATNEKLEIVAKKVINLYTENKNVVVVVSAQGKTTDRLIAEAKELSEEPFDREMDALLSAGEQMSAAKLSILINKMGYSSISLTGWQAGIYTNKINQNAIIQTINPERILKELEEKKIVIIAGFQGINENMDITTLGRGGSDTTAVAIAAAVNAKECYIYSDVDGVYSADPRLISNPKKIDKISYDKMFELSNEGAKVLHNRCVQIAQKFNIKIIAKSTFKDNSGTIISQEIEKEAFRSLVCKNNFMFSIVGNKIIEDTNLIKNILDLLYENNIEIEEIVLTDSKIKISLKKEIGEVILNSIHKLLI